MKRDWTTLEKGDKLYLLVPFGDGQGGFKYVYQESEVIAVHFYDYNVNIRFKYSDVTGKRQRIELNVNKVRYDDWYVAANKQTRWAAQYAPKYGELIVSYVSKDILKEVYKKIVDEEISEKLAAINSLNKYIEQLDNAKDFEF